MSELWTSWVHAGSRPNQPTLFTLAFYTMTRMPDHVSSLFCAASRPGKWHLWKRLFVLCPLTNWVQESPQVDVFPVCFREASLNLSFAVRQSSAVEILKLKEGVLFWKIRLSWNWHTLAGNHSHVFVFECNKTKIFPMKPHNLTKILQLFKTILLLQNARQLCCCSDFQQVQKTFRFKHFHSLQSGMLNEQLLRGVLKEDPTGKRDKLSLIWFVKVTLTAQRSQKMMGISSPCPLCVIVDADLSILLSLQGEVWPCNAFVKLSDFASKYPEVNFLSVPFSSPLLHVCKWTVTKWKKKKKSLNKLYLRRPISEAYKTCVFLGEAGFLAFWRQDRPGFLWTPKQPLPAPHCTGYHCVPSLFGSHSSFWCWSFPWLSHILK